MADQEMGRSLNPLPYHIMDYLWTMVHGAFAIFEKEATGIPFSMTKGKQLLVDVMLSARRNFNLVCARVSTGELPGAPSCAPGYAHSALSQRIYDAAFARGSAIPARY